MPETSAGIHLEQATGQKYSIHIPHRHMQGETVPLIVLLHWGGQKYRYHGRDILEQFGFPAFSEMEAIIVAPDRKRKHWAMPRAAKDLARLIDYLDEHYHLDHRKRAVVGFSAGGMGVWYLGAERPDLFSCGVAVASPVPAHLAEMRWRFPVYAVHSELDELFPYRVNAERVAAMQEQGAPVTLKMVEFASHTNVRDYIPAAAQSAGWMREIWGES